MKQGLLVFGPSPSYLNPCYRNTRTHLIGRSLHTAYTLTMFLTLAMVSLYRTSDFASTKRLYGPVTVATLFSITRAAGYRLPSRTVPGPVLVI